MLVSSLINPLRRAILGTPDLERRMAEYYRAKRDLHEALRCASCERHVDPEAPCASMERGERGPASEKQKGRSN